MDMEEEWEVDRARLRKLRREHPTWSQSKLAEATKRSVTWVKKWRKRLDEADPDDREVLKSRSRRPKEAGSPIEALVIERILAIRDDPPVNRIAGPETIKYFLHKQEEEDPLNCYLPTSTSTIWRILDEHQRIYRPQPPEHEPLPLAEPMEIWQIDFKDITTVGRPEETDKQQHFVETLNIVDAGTSILVDNPARLDFNAETSLRTLAGVLQKLGCPRQITFDRDPRFIASASTGDFPSPFVRFLACLGIKPDICPPRQPWKNPYVERYNRTYNYETILIYRPETYEQVIDMNLDEKQFYNYQRPNQAKSCGNRPPRLAFPDLPALPPVPEIVDPDRWLETIDGDLFTRRVNAAGTVQIDKHKYYIGRAYHGQTVVLQVDAANQQFNVELAKKPLKTIPIKGLEHGQMPFDQYLEFICKQAVSAWRLYLRKHRHYLPLAV
jgi:hypothetical protein